MTARGVTGELKQIVESLAPESPAAAPGGGTWA